MKPASPRARALVAGTGAGVTLALSSAVVMQLVSGGIRVGALGPVVTAAFITPLGCLLMTRRPGLRLGPLFVAVGLGFAVGSMAASALDYGARHPIPTLAAQACFAAVSFSRVLIAAWVAFIVWLPDGVPSSRGWRRFVTVSAGLCAVTGVAVWLVGPADRVFDFYRGTAVPAGAAGPFAGTWPPLGGLSNLLLLLPLGALASLVQRHRTSGDVARQQARWLLAALTVNILAQVIGAVLVSTTTGPTNDAASLLSVVTQPLSTLAATLAIMRYRLWEIDLVVSRAVVYGVLWAGLSGLLLVPALAAGLFVGGQSAGAAVGIALLLTAVFQPARRRLEAVAERLVYRHRARPYVLLSGFWETLRSADLDRVGPLVADAVRRGLHVEWAGVWIYSGSATGGTLRPLAASGTTADASADISADTAEQLYDARALVLDGPPAGELQPLWCLPPEAVVPLVTGDELVGLLACGGRRGDRLHPADFELLELLAREGALRLRNLRLEAQLRERLSQIEAQAAELARSRQRLVTAQDEERRRIERNLHDGVQQQLVSLAARLQRAAAEGPVLLGALAAEAEHAVFALQELGRGIYPSVLADRGLPAALRTQAARMPVTVQLEVDDALVERRLDRDVEAALYFVALEAMTNAYKHAAPTSISIWLRLDEAGVGLDIVDNGRGLDGDRPAGTGLQNMHDRVAAVGGTLSIVSDRAHGTRVAASVPVSTPRGVPDGQPLAADSRR